MATHTVPGPSPRRPVVALPGGGTLDAYFPAGNIVVEQVSGDEIALHQDLRDTEGWWFWWCFRVRGAGGRRLRFRFTQRAVLGPRGPACSVDGGWHWHWLGAAADRTQFEYAFPVGVEEVRFAFAMPYVQRDLEGFLAAYAGHPALRREVLCQTAKGRAVERLHAGRLDGAAPWVLVLTARHHACESVANLAMEGILEAVLGETATGSWFRQAVEVLAIPFVDKDGVEDGDQGKNRRPRDHNRDYADPSVHASVRAIREYVPAWVAGRPLVALDLHCPYMSGAYNEHAYFVGQEDPRHWHETGRLASWLERVRRGPAPYAASGNLPFGQAWNTGSNVAGGCSFARWARSIPGSRLAVSLEFPYANLGEWTVSASGARAFGRDLTEALRQYMLEPGDSPVGT